MVFVTAVQYWQYQPQSYYKPVILTSSQVPLPNISFPFLSFAVKCGLVFDLLYLCAFISSLPAVKRLTTEMFIR